jgi:hypothetical protein
MMRRVWSSNMPIQVIEPNVRIASLVSSLQASASQRFGQFYDECCDRGLGRRVRAGIEALSRKVILENLRQLHPNMSVLNINNVLY